MCQQEITDKSIEHCPRVVTTETLIEEAKAIHGDKYDYSKTQYRSKGYKVIVTCPTHGDFEVFAREHLDGKGCSKCAKGEKFIQKLQAKFGDKFLLDKFVYKSSIEPVELICPIHGSFSRTPSTILNSVCGCPECGSELARHLNDKAHAEAEEKKAEIKKQKEVEHKVALSNWYKEWGEVIEDCSKEIDLWPDGNIESFVIIEDQLICNPVDAYRTIVDQYIDVIRRGGIDKIAIVGLTPLPENKACKLSNYRRGDTYYLIPNLAAKKKVVDYAVAVYKSGEEQLCYNLSHRGCHVSFIDDNLLIREERSPFYTFTNDAESLFATLREQGVDEWESMKVYVCPFDDILYVTEDIKMESARFSNDVTKWFIIPFDERCNANVIKYGCDVYYRLMYSYRLFKSENETRLYDLVKEDIEYIYEDVAQNMGFAVSTIKNLVRNLERYGAFCVTKYQGSFVVNEKKCKEFTEKTFLDDYTKMFRDISEYSKSPHANYKPTTNIKKISCNSNSTRIEDMPSSFVGIDFETLYSQRVSACSVGMVKYKEGKIVDRYYSLIRPPYDYPGKSGIALTLIHGFTEEMLKNERTFAEVLPEMEAFAEGLPLVAHNACVERACICETSKFYGLTTTLDYQHIIDTYPLSKRTERTIGINIEGSGTHSLDAVCRRFNVPEMRHHNALDDAEMCGNLLLAFKKVLSNTDAVVLPSTMEVVVTPKINPEDKVQRADLENIEDNPFKDKVVVLTGFAKADSQQYAHKLNELGAIIKDSVNKKTNILITGYNAGPSKLKKAEEFGAQVIPENEFLEMLKSL